MQDAVATVLQTLTDGSTAHGLGWLPIRQSLLHILPFVA